MDIDSVLKAHGIGASGGSNIKSLQRGNISTYELYGNEKTVSISSVNLDNTIVRISIESRGTGLRNHTYNTSAYLKDDKTLVISIRGASSSTGQYLIVRWEVIEFNNVKKVQRGMLRSYSGTAYASISKVNLEKSLLFYTSSDEVYDGSTGDYNPDSIYSMHLVDYGYFSTDSGLGFSHTRDSRDTYRNYYWEVIEFN